MAFYSASSYKPQIRQEGFHLPSPPPSVPSPPPQSQFDPNSMFMPHFLPDSFRKAHADSSQPSMDFTDELASLMANSPQPAQHQHTPHHHQSHERSTQSPDASERSPHNQSQHQQQYRHNIFDISAPHSSYQQHPQPQQFSLPTQLPPLSTPFHDPSYNSSNQTSSPHAPTHYSNGLPTLSSSLRYDPREGPPSAYHHPVDYSRSESADARSRSRSRPPTASEPPSTHGGPARTARPKRGSVSSVSPPRHGAHPHAILIPPHRQSTSGLPVSPLSMHSASTWHQEFSLPTPDSLGTGAFGSYGTPGAGGISPKDIGTDPSQDAAAKQAMIANEKRRRRRESHNAVERRRRDNINEKISELATLIPECMLDPGVSHSAPTQTPTSPTPDDVLLGNLIPEGASQVAAGEDSGKSEGAGESVVKANKGMILRKSVEYIRYLQQLVMAQANRNRELEAQIGALRTSDSPSPSTHHNGTHTSIHGNGSVVDELILHDELHHVGSGKWGHALSALAESESDDVDMEADGTATAERGRQRHRTGAIPGIGEDIRVKEEGMEVS
ncbi:HLH-domain-containing protein [Russula earlei]|uniref:HLH-domain-containing protein n=1 Tax=Russula earlei TaxID=71964 RepID=A0ACC0TZ40_9AGAM|nr:HLH-domain-containing protein [Russula earlei]